MNKIAVIIGSAIVGVLGILPFASFWLLALPLAERTSYISQSFIQRIQVLSTEYFLVMVAIGGTIIALGLLSGRNTKHWAPLTGM